MLVLPPATVSLRRAKRSPGELREFFSPVVETDQARPNLFLDERTNSAQFRKRSIPRCKISDFFRPKKRAACGAPKRACQNASLTLRLLREQFRNLTIRQHI